MSRSYREPYWTDGYGSTHKKWAKRQASKKVRRSKKITNGMMYKRVYCSYNICDYKFYDNRTEDDNDIRFRYAPWWQVRRK